jgi:hypothetical protein
VSAWRGQTPPQAPFVYSVAFGPNGQESLKAIVSTLSDQGIAHMEGGYGAEIPCLHIRSSDVAEFLRCVVQSRPGAEIYLRNRARKVQPLTPETIENATTLAKSFDLLVAERSGEIQPSNVPVVVAEDGAIVSMPIVSEPLTHTQCSEIRIALWHPGEGPYGSRHWNSDRSFAQVARVREKTFDAMMRSGHNFDDDLPAPINLTEPIDIVYTWVDGDDDEWQAVKSQYSGKTPSARAAHDERFRSRDELKYSLRSVEMFAPWVRKIHIVTAGQRPDWLDVDHPKINLVDHSDIYRDPSWLPTFNSSSIETQLHHIPGLAKHFLYFNDDFFLGQMCHPSDFFHANGLMKFFPSSQRAYEPDIDHHSEEYIQADKNAIEALVAVAPSVGREIMLHVPYPSDRDLLFELEERFPDLFAASAASRFRSPQDLRPIAFMQYHYGFQVRAAVRATISHRYLALWKPEIHNQLVNVLLRRRFKTFCINDVDLTEERTAEVNRAVVEFLEAYFPFASTFERP